MDDFMEWRDEREAEYDAQREYYEQVQLAEMKAKESEAGE